MQLIKKIRQGCYILRLTGFKYFRASQLKNKSVTYKINNRSIIIEGQSVLSMLIGVAILDEYHLRKQYQHPKIIIDVGANVGVFSIYASTLFTDCTIYAFEPSAENFQLLKKNTKPFSNIHCLNMGISNYSGTAYISGGDDCTAFKTSPSRSSNELNQCEVVSLEAFLSDNLIKDIDILKLDCEGAEYDIAESNLQHVRQVVGEYHRMENQTPESLKKAFTNQGFIFKQWTGNPNETAGLFWGINSLSIA